MLTADFHTPAVFYPVSVPALCVLITREIGAWSRYSDHSKASNLLHAMETIKVLLGVKAPDDRLQHVESELWHGLPPPHGKLVFFANIQKSK